MLYKFCIFAPKFIPLYFARSTYLLFLIFFSETNFGRIVVQVHEIAFHVFKSLWLLLIKFSNSLFIVKDLFILFREEIQIRLLRKDIFHG